MSVRAIPKSAVKSLVKYCEEAGDGPGRPAVKVFGTYLKLMKRHAGYFFGEPWPEVHEEKFSLNTRDVEFLEKSGDYADLCERFTLVCLRRNISLEGFDSEGFTMGFNGYGERECWDCSVPEAMRLRKEVERVEKLRRKYEEEVALGSPSWIAEKMYEHLRRSDIERYDKMQIVKLKLYEEDGGAEGKSCEVKNRYRCPYGEESAKLIEDGGAVNGLWHLVDWYDSHWNLNPGVTPAAHEMRWYHFGESSIIDVTSIEDVLKAVDDGRLDRIIGEYERYVKETERAE